MSLYLRRFLPLRKSGAGHPPPIRLQSASIWPAIEALHFRRRRTIGAESRTSQRPPQAVRPRCAPTRAGTGTSAPRNANRTRSPLIEPHATDRARTVGIVQRVDRADRGRTKALAGTRSRSRQDPRDRGRCRGPVDRSGARRSPRTACSLRPPSSRARRSARLRPRPERAR